MAFNKKITAVFMVAILLLSSVAGIMLFADDNNYTHTVAIIEESIELGDFEQLPAFDYNFEIVYQNTYAILLLDRSVNGVRILKNDGTYFDTLVLTGQAGNQITRNIQRSDFNLMLYRDLFAGSTIFMDSYTNSVSSSQVEYRLIDGGFAAEFTLGDADAVSLTMFPMFMDMDRMEELVMQYMTTAQRSDWLSNFYRPIDGRFVRAWATYDSATGDPTNVPIPRLRRLYEAFYTIGSYSYEELAYDNAYWGEPNFEPLPLVSLVVEYRLDGPDFVIRIPRDGMEFLSHQPFGSITLHPYFLSGSIHDEGYIFIPDGSGGIIEFNNGMSTYEAALPVFGHNPLNNAFFYREPFEQATLPVYGIVNGDRGILAIIEEGAPVATIHANVSGRIDEFNRVFASFELLFQENVILRGGNISNATNRFLDDVYDMDIVQRYIFLTGDNANYLGMARAYQNFLASRNALSTNNMPYEAPFFVDFIATAPRQQVFMGVPYTHHFAMTTTDDVQGILVSLQNAGINNIFAQYSHWANGGMLSERLDNIRPLRSIGGAAGMRSLQNFADNSGINLFPSVRAGTFMMLPNHIGSTRRSMLTRNVSNNRTTVPWFQMANRDFNGGAFMLSPKHWEAYANRIVSNIEGLGLNNIAVMDMGNLLFGNYARRYQITRIDALYYADSMFEALNNDKGLMLSNPNAYAFVHANAVTDLPFGRGSRRIVDFYVPFVQMVLENNVVYSMPAYNIDSMAWRGFKEYMLRAIESRSAMKLILTNEAEMELMPTFINFWVLNDMMFQTQYSRWQGRIGEYFAVFNEFWQAVYGAYMVSHDVFNAGAAVRVEYSNGIIVYINYARDTWEIDGISVAPLSFEMR